MTGIAAAALLALAVVSWPAAAQQGAIVLDADSTELDRKNDLVVFKQVRVVQGDIEISAARAESKALEFADSTWRFIGNVRIVTSEGEIASDAAAVRFADSRLTGATAQGEPARFRRAAREAERETVSGTARQIEFDIPRQRVVLTGQATVQDGPREVSGGRLTYLMAEDRLIASSDESGDERVRVVIVPEDEDAGEAGAEPEQP
ncbi:MAG: lipopolysaccharide transport periplasmic protein LptA [Gammaproteobacteria bacterium]